MEDETAAAAASGLLDNVQDDNSQEEVINQNDSENLQENQEQKPAQKEDGDPEEDLVGKNTPLHKHPRWKERTQQLRESRAKTLEVEQRNVELERRLASIESKVNNTSGLDETIRTEIAQITSNLPRRDFGGEDFKTWEDAYPVIRDMLIEDVMAVSKHFSDKNQSAQSQKESEKKTQERGWAEELVDIEDEIDNPEQYSAFRSWVEQQLGNNVSYKSFNDAYNKWLQVKNKQLAQKPGKPNVNKVNASKVLTNGKPNQSGNKAIDYRYIASHSMQDIADNLTRKQ